MSSTQKEREREGEERAEDEDQQWAMNAHRYRGRRGERCIMGSLNQLWTLPKRKVTSLLWNRGGVVLLDRNWRRFHRNLVSSLLTSPPLEPSTHTHTCPSVIRIKAVQSVCFRNVPDVVDVVLGNARLHLSAASGRRQRRHVTGTAVLLWWRGWGGGLRRPSVAKQSAEIRTALLK